MNVHNLILSYRWPLDHIDFGTYHAGDYPLIVELKGFRSSFIELAAQYQLRLDVSGLESTLERR